MCRKYVRNALVLAFVGGCALAALTSTAQAETVYDASADFSLNSNPIGVWSYAAWNMSANFYGNATASSASYGGLGLPGWDWGASNWQPCIVSNRTGATVDLGGSGAILIPSNSIMLYPGNGTGTLLVFTAPTTGLYNVSASMTDIATGNTARDLSDGHNGPAGGVYRWDATTPFILGDGAQGQKDWMYMSLYGDTLTYSANAVTLTAGDKIALLVWPDGMGNGDVWDLGNDAVAASFVVTAVPEPTALIMLVNGLIGLLAYAWRKRK